METLVVVDSVKGKFGPQVKDVANNYFSFGKFYKGDTTFPPGTKLEVDVFQTAKGNRYINSAKVVGNDVSVVATAPKDAPKPTFKAKDDISMTKQEWQAKDRSQLIGGLSHDAATLAAVVLNLDGSNQPGTDSALQVYKTLLEGMLKIRDGIK